MKKIITILLIGIIFFSGCINEEKKQDKSITTDESYSLKTIDKSICENASCPSSYPNHDCYYCKIIQEN